jgi:hypothetical protein
MRSFVMAWHYHSRTRFATRSVEALVSFSASASSNINLSSSGGRYDSREFVQDIEMFVLDRERDGVPGGKSVNTKAIRHIFFNLRDTWL